MLYTIFALMAKILVFLITQHLAITLLIFCLDLHPVDGKTLTIQ